MADIIPLHCSPHEQAQALLPWYANGTLDAAESALVDAHLAACAECRASLDVEHALAAQVASLPMDLLFGFYVSLPRESAIPTYRALGSEPTTEPGNVLVIFQPDVSERDMRTALLQTDARLVDGPNTSGAYVLRVAPASRGDALRQLRGLPQILLAEPVDAGSPG